jgi:hypothetical protein
LPQQFHSSICSAFFVSDPSIQLERKHVYVARKQFFAGVSRCGFEYLEALGRDTRLR